MTPSARAQPADWQGPPRNVSTTMRRTRSRRVRIPCTTPRITSKGKNFWIFPPVPQSTVGFQICYHPPCSLAELVFAHGMPDSTQPATGGRGMSHALVHSRTSGNFDEYSPEQYSGSEDEIPSISVLPSFLHPPIPPYLRIPLSLLGEENLQIRRSGIDATDTDMKSYVLG